MGKLDNNERIKNRAMIEALGQFLSEWDPDIDPFEIFGFIKNTEHIDYDDCGILVWDRYDDCSGKELADMIDTAYTANMYFAEFVLEVVG